MQKYILFDRASGTILRHGSVSEPGEAAIQTAGDPALGVAMPVDGASPFVHSGRMRVDAATSTVRDIATDAELFPITITPET